MQNAFRANVCLASYPFFRPTYFRENCTRWAIDRAKEAEIDASLSLICKDETAAPENGINTHLFPTVVSIPGKPSQPILDGYLSDGDASFFPPHRPQSATPGAPIKGAIDDGYLSEGGASAIYARR